jgi:hypothetical protein
MLAAQSRNNDIRVQNELHQTLKLRISHAISHMFHAFCLDLRLHLKLPRIICAAIFMPIITSVLPAHAQFEEQIEAGRAHLANGKDIDYRIRLLPLASFPELPPAIYAQLNQRHCLIPQTYEARQPENVSHGSFREKGSDDWAILCSQSASTTLYVIYGNEPEAPIALRHQKNSDWLGTSYAGNAVYGSAWGIALRRPTQMQGIGQGIGKDKRNLSIDHDGIEDAFLEKSASIHYYGNGAWITLDEGN